jgi:DNA-binding response OmpR family regulator
MQTNRRGAAAPQPEPLCVGLVAIGTTDGVEALQERLRADSVQVELWNASVLQGEPPAARCVVLACLPRAAADATLQLLASWCGRGAEPVAIVGYSPQGVSADSERALAAGFDDFIAGRESPREVSARVRAVARRLRRIGAGNAERLHFGRVMLDLARHELSVGSVSISLTPLELQLMKALIESGNRPLTREQLLASVWGTENVEVGSRAIDNLVFRLRRKLGEQRVFEVVRGVGFRLLAK